jgi:hypothetical protein
MSGQTTGVIAAVLSIAVLAFAMFYAQRFMLRRAVRKVVLQFRKQGAISPATAATLDEFRLLEGSPFLRMFRLRDYRPYASRLLGQANIIRATEGGRVYLSEEDLAVSSVRKFARLD